MRVCELPELSPPEEVVPFHDPQTGATGVIVLHSTVLGPAAGGCRLWGYSSNEEAVVDALRLAEGMTMKNALAELPLGGGKVALREPVGDFDRRALFRAIGRAIEMLDGRYVTAEDVGTTVEDMIIVAGETPHVAGLPAEQGRPGGDPSPWTALGVFEAMRVAVRHRLGADLEDVVVAVQGLGHVGFALCEFLHRVGTKLLVAEPRAEVAARAAMRFDATVMSGPALLRARADVFAPCALGGVLDTETVRGLKAKIVCGAANNQLAQEVQAFALAERDILYAPDFLVNAGGIVNIGAEYLGWGEADVRTRVEQIGPRLAGVIKRAEAQSTLPHAAAKALAMERVSNKQQLDAAV